MIFKRLVVFLLLKWLTTCASITVRVRLSSGVMQRVDIGEEDNVEDLRSKLQQQDIIQTSSMMRYKDRNLTDLKATLKSMGVIAGDIFEVKDVETTCTVPKNTTTSPKKIAPTSTKKKVVTSIADLKKIKASLVKIAGQKLSRDTSVLLPTSTSVVLRRVASSGSVALLFGFATNNTKTRALSLDIKAAYELVQEDVVAFLQREQSLAELPIVSRLRRLAARLGLDIIGCAVGSTGNSTTNRMWGAPHVFSALQLRNLSSSPADFAILSTRMIAPGKPTLSSKKQQSPVVDDLTVESFFLSQQAVELHRRDVLGTRFASPAQANEEKLQLNGEVLVQSEQVSILDPVLFAVPVPLGRAAPRAVGPRRPGTRKKLEIPALDHSFPSDAELRALGSEDKLRQYLFKVLSRLSKKGWSKSQLLDFHLLLRLADLLDADSMQLLGDSLRDEDLAALPKQLHVALDMGKLALSDEDDDDE